MVDACMSCPVTYNISQKVVKILDPGGVLRTASTHTHGKTCCLRTTQTFSNAKGRVFYQQICYQLKCHISRLSTKQSEPLKQTVEKHGSPETGRRGSS